MLQAELDLEDRESGARTVTIERDLALAQQRLDVLLDALLDGTIDKETHDERKSLLIARKLDLREQLQQPAHSTFWRIMAERFELGFAALQSYESGTDDEKREILKSVSSNLVVHGKEPEFAMISPFADLKEWRILKGCAHPRRSVRTFMTNNISLPHAEPHKNAASHKECVQQRTIPYVDPPRLSR